MATRVELSVGHMTCVPSLADQIKRFQPRVFNNPESDSRVFDRSAKVRRVFFYMIQKSQKSKVEHRSTMVSSRMPRLTGQHSVETHNDL